MKSKSAEWFNLSISYSAIIYLEARKHLQNYIILFVLLVGFKFTLNDRALPSLTVLGIPTVVF